MLPIGALFYRNQPERYGMKPDGNWSKEKTENIEKATDINDTKKKDWTAKEAFKT